MIIADENGFQGWPLHVESKPKVKPEVQEGEFVPEKGFPFLDKEESKASEQS